MNPTDWPRAVLFDMDGTLVDTEPAAVEAVRRAAADFGRVLAEADAEALIGLPWGAIFAMLIERYGLPETPGQLRDRLLRHKAAVLADGLRVMPGAVAAARFAAARWPMAVVSGSFREEVRDVLTRLGLTDAARFYLGAEDVVPGKPDPGPFLEAARRLGVAPAACLVFEDSAMGLRAARAAGMYAVAVEAAGYGASMDLSEAHERLASFAEADPAWWVGVAARGAAWRAGR